MMACCERKWDRNLDFGERFKSAFSAGRRHSALTASANTLNAETGGLAGLLTSSKEIGDAPPAFLNYLFFDSEMNYKYGGFVQMSNAAREDGSDVPHEQLSRQVVAEEPGFFYIYLSNESNTGSEAFFDDFSVQVSESFIVQQIDYYPYGMVAREFRRLGDKATNDLFQGKTFEDLTRWYDFHARQYDAAVGRWFGVDAMASKMPGMSPYNAMANNPIMFTDPDGNEPITIAAAIAFIIKGAAIGGGLMGAAYTASAAMLPGGLKQNFQWSQFGRAVGTGALLGAISGGAKAIKKAGWQMFGSSNTKVFSNAFGGLINAANNHDPAKGLGWHTLGHFAAGYIGTAVSIETSSIEGFVAGGILNAYVGFGTRKDVNLYGVAQDLVAGGLASLAGKSFYKTVSPPQESSYSNSVLNDKIFKKSVPYGLQNVAANFAFDKSQSYFNDKADLKIAGSFLIGSFGGLAQSGIMKGSQSEGGFGRFGKVFGLSTFAYLGEYAANYMWNSSSRPPSLSFSGYYGYKQASYGIKSMFYTYLNW